MKDFNNGTKNGLAIMLAAGLIMAVLAAVSKPVPNWAAWIFFAGIVITIVSALIAKKAQ